MHGETVKFTSVSDFRSSLYKKLIFLCVVQQPDQGLGGVIAEISRSHTIRHTNILDGTPLNE